MLVVVLRGLYGSRQRTQPCADPSLLLLPPGVGVPNVTQGFPGTRATRLWPSCLVEPAATALGAHGVPSFLPPALLSDLRAVIPQPPEAPLSDGIKVPAVLPSLMIGIFLPLAKGASRRLPGGRSPNGTISSCSRNALKRVCQDLIAR